MKVVILAGGAGSRMGAATQKLPKPMLPVAGKPILEHQLELVRRHGFGDVILSTGYLGQVIRDYFGDGGRWGLHISYAQEDRPLGTAGAVQALAPQLADDFLVLYGDTMLNVDLTALVAAHRRRRGLGVLLVHPNDHPHDSDLLETETDDRIIAFHRKPRPAGEYYRNLVSAALYVLSPGILPHLPAGQPSDFGRDIFPKLVAAGLPLYAYNSPEYIKDVGTPQRLAEVEHDVVTGRLARLSREHARPAVFLDRDGVLNADRPDHVRSAEQLELLPGVAVAIRTLNRSDYLAVVITNQPVIAKGFASAADVARIHAKLDTLLGAEGAFLDRIYVCPHHPEKGFAGERPELKIDCPCRKPRTGLIDRAAAELHIDRARSVFVGDSTTDIQTGINAGLRTILVQTGAAGRDGKYACQPDHVAADLAAAVGWVVAERSEERRAKSAERGATNGE